MWRERARVTNLPITYLLGMAPDSFGSCLGPVLEHPGRAVTALPSHCISRTIWNPWQYVIAHEWWWPLFLCTQSSGSTEGSVARVCTQTRAPASWLPGVVMTWDMEDNEDGFRFLQENPNAFPHVQTPQGLIYDYLALSPNHRINSFRTACQSKGWNTRAHEG